MSKITQTYQLTKICNVPPNPVQLFKMIIDRIKEKFLAMNLATVDKEFGVLNRTVVYRGLIDNTDICFVTERNSRKYQNILENPKVSLSLLFSVPNAIDENQLNETWQIRIFDAVAVELEETILQEFWEKEPLFAKIRSHITECGKPRDREELERLYNEIYESYQRNCKEPEQTKTFTAFKIIPKCWDFYKSEPNKIADRVEYKKLPGPNHEWEVYHVDP